MIPLILRLKREAHKNIASAQDTIVQELYKIFDKAILHGGTGIWRCYHGNRFSEDIDAYLQKDTEKVELLFQNLQKAGFTIIKKKVSERSIYSELQLNRTFVRLEAIFKKTEGTLGEYETADGNILTVYTLTPEDFISEKVNAYLSRQKIRDLYDIFFLLRYVKDSSKVKYSLKHLISGFKKPVDEAELKVLIMEGIVPSSEKMLEYIRNNS